jgi:hypothetical protein
MWVTAERPEDYKGRAVAVSDVLSIKKDGVINSHYANGRVFRELLSFTGEEGRIYRREFEEEPIKQLLATNSDEKKIIEIDINEPVSVERIFTQEKVTPIVTEEPQTIQTAVSPQNEIKPQAEEKEIQTSAPPTVMPPSALPVIKHELSVYRLSAKEAEEHGATDGYELSRRMDIDCAVAISKAIQTHKKGENRYDLITPAEVLLKEYGAERMMWVLSKHVVVTSKRFSELNRSWAKAFLDDGTGSGDDIPAFNISIHHAVLDAFINELRTVLDKKPTFNEKMKAAKTKSEAHNNQNG